MATYSEISKHCLDCHYRLDNLDSNHCPEYGREFFNDHTTYIRNSELKRTPLGKYLSWVHLIWGSLALIGFAAFFNDAPVYLKLFFCLAIPFYIATITLLTFVHPLICFVLLIKARKKQKGETGIALHLIWSLLIAGAFWLMILNGYVITA